MAVCPHFNIVLMRFKVKCNRNRPTCSQCKSGSRKCVYVEKESKVQFVEETCDLASVKDRNDSSSGTWKSAINQQAKNVKQSTSIRHEVPLWAVAEAHEVGAFTPT